MNEICTICGRYFYNRDYPPRLCPICEEESMKSGDLSFHRSRPKRMFPTAEKRP